MTKRDRSMTPQVWTAMSNSRREQARASVDSALIPLKVPSGVSSQALRRVVKVVLVVSNKASMIFLKNLSSSSQWAMISRKQGRVQPHHRLSHNREKGLAKHEEKMLM